jgi:hypothetical protein
MQKISLRNVPLHQNDSFEYHLILCVLWTFESLQSSKLLFMGFEVLAVVKEHSLILWVMTPCLVVGWYSCFGGQYCLHHQGTRYRWWWWWVSPKLWWPPTRLHGVETHKTTVWRLLFRYALKILFRLSFIISQHIIKFQWVSVSDFVVMLMVHIHLYSKSTGGYCRKFEILLLEIYSVLWIGDQVP